MCVCASASASVSVIVSVCLHPWLWLWLWLFLCVHINNSTFCDNIMKTGGDKIEGEIDIVLDKIVMLFSYLSDKVCLSSKCLT